MRPGVLAIVIAVACLTRPASVVEGAATSEFVGTIPCDARPRAFVGGLAPAARCHAITWRLTLVSGAAGGSRFSLAAVYGVPPQSNPNAMVDGPRVAVTGTLESTGGVYRLTSAATGKSLRLIPVSDGLLHFVNDDESLAVGNGGWSYTLNRADLAEPPGNPAPAPDMSYTISPRGSGAAVFGVFEGRTPCAGIARELKLTPIAGCMKVKWRVTLLRAPGTSTPTTYTIESSLHRQQARQGTWRVTRGTPSNPNAVVYHLDATPTEAPVLLLQGDDNVLFFLNQQKRPLIGTAEFGYTLNRAIDAR